MQFSQLKILLIYLKQLIKIHKIYTYTSTRQPQAAPPQNQNRRREGENYAARDLDDIFCLLSHLDEQKLMNSLPVYVTDDPDRMPSCHLFEGDLKYFFKKLDVLDNKVESYWKSTAAIVGQVHSHLSEWPALVPPKAHVSQKSTST